MILRKILIRFLKYLEKYYNDFEHTCMTCRGLSIYNGVYIKNAFCPIRYTGSYIVHKCYFWNSSCLYYIIKNNTKKYKK